MGEIFRPKTSQFLVFLRGLFFFEEGAFYKEHFLQTLSIFAPRKEKKIHAVELQCVSGVFGFLHVDYVKPSKIIIPELIESKVA